MVGVSLRAGAIVGVGVWIALSWACSAATPTKTSTQTVSGASESGEAGAPADAGAGAEDAADEAPSHPVYNGAPGATEQPMQSGSIAAPDGSCPIPDSLSQQGIQCPSCAQSHCAGALSSCDPTMVTACTEYYCPMQCLSPSAAASGACSMLTSCCPALFGTLLNTQCVEAQLGGVTSTCASFIAQAQSKGYCK